MMHKGRAVFVAASLLALAAWPAAAEQPYYASPEAALDALKAALVAKDGAAIIAILGPENEGDLLGGDPALARQALDELSGAAAQGMALEANDDGSQTIVMGRQDWEMPVPLVKEDKGWRFDTEAGIEEIADRQVGSNELTAIGLLRTYVDAQLDYAEADRDGDKVLEYAQKIISSPGKQDGLYWPAEGDAELSPLGPLVAGADAYTTDYYKIGEPYHGYYYKILTEQGAGAPGGKYGYVINDNMIAGFAMIAWPADWGQSGVMTFAVNHQGTVFEKDLGADTAKLAPEITAYDPGEGWDEVTDDE